MRIVREDDEDAANAKVAAELGKVCESNLFLGDIGARS